MRVCAMTAAAQIRVTHLWPAAGSLDVDRNDVKRYLSFVNQAIYDLLLAGQATAKANARDII